MAATLAAMSGSSENSVFRSGDLAVYPRSGQIEIQGKVVSLGLVNMQVLVTLLEYGGEVVSRAEIFDRVWKNQTVSDDTLTRCISEIRTQLGRYSSHSKLIETLPKRGYRWVPEVFREAEAKVIVSTPRKGVFQRGWKRVSIAALIGLALLLLFTMSVLWVIDTSIRPELVRVALIPVYTNQPNQDSMAADIDDLLREQLLATKNLRFFARSTVGSDLQNHFPYLSRELSAQWIIEGNIRQKQDKLRVSLSLVDAKTALVVYTLTQDLDNDPSQLEKVCTSFIGEISQVLSLDSIE
jgi:DNA-binding winged helix-turn-helix (wHTH) protein/TolB-like protein